MLAPVNDERGLIGRLDLHADGAASLQQDTGDARAQPDGEVLAIADRIEIGQGRGRAAAISLGDLVEADARLLLPIEIISHLARVLSLTVRLYANMFAGDLLTIAFFSLIPIGIPLVFLGLHLGVAVIQAYVFMLLAAIYLSLAVAHDH